MRGDEDGRGRILLVEDEGLLLWSMRTFLTNRGYQVDAVGNGDQGLALLQSGDYDVLVTDLMLGGIEGLDGLELTDRARERNPEMQVVIITGHGSKETVINALRKGVWDWLEKPFDLEILLITVEKAMEKKRLARELVRLSRTDGMTGLFNVRHFYEVLDQEMQRVRRQGHSLTLLMVDLDNFKQYNDHHGHLEGDEALLKIAQALQAASRRGVDKTFRYGGDEFVLIIPEATLDTAREISERIRNHAKGLGLDGISLSIGLAELRDGEEMKGFIRRADEAMYLAKQMGGDRVIVFSHRA